MSNLGPLVTPLPGVTQVSTVQFTARAHQIRLTDADRQVLDARFPHGRLSRERSRPRATPTIRPDAEIVMVMGIPAAGKSTLTQQFVAEGFLRLSRDESGTLRGLLPALR